MMRTVRAIDRLLHMTGSRGAWFTTRCRLTARCALPPSGQIWASWDLLVLTCTWKNWPASFSNFYCPYLYRVDRKRYWSVNCCCSRHIQRKSRPAVVHSVAEEVLPDIQAQSFLWHFEIMSSQFILVCCWLEKLWLLLICSVPVNMGPMPRKVRHMSGVPVDEVTCRRAWPVYRNFTSRQLGSCYS